ncbi:retron Eco8 family effector endonuclease [Bacillus spizizenii]|nr:retron Eco8 family effector endonuclease [Bacillus spizizenii]MCY9364314.1 retron Eco8 family effector endonuclease [Bacillus spizizenii]
MAIKNVYINNCLSIKKANVELNNINCFIGENGVGKSTLYKIIKYFYGSLVDENIKCELHDTQNPFNDTLNIKITFDFKFYNSMLENTDIFNRNKPFYKKLVLLSKLVKDNDLTVSLIHSKKYNKVTWENNIPYELRTLIHGLYPFYFIEARKIDLHDWSQLWKMVAEMSIFPDETTDFDKILEESQGEKYAKFLTIINETIKENDFKVDKYSIKQQFLSILKLRLKGEVFSYKNKDLSYYSDGLNSFNYIKMFIQLVFRITDYRKTKYPTILIDEPEIGLHPKLIDEMVDAIGNSGNTTVWINTHSSRLVKNVLSRKYNYSIYHVSMRNSYTLFNQMTKPQDKRELRKISEKEASFYFSRGIVLVEGLTELQVFSNENLEILFPFLKEVDFYSFDGDDKLNLDIVHPDKKNVNIPYLLLVDGDKLYYIRKKQIKFINSKDHINPLNNRLLHKRENLYYGKKRYNTLMLRKRINAIVSNSKFPMTKHFLTMPSLLYDETLELIKTYCLNYNIYPIKTTIEGVLVNDKNYNEFAGWLKLTNKLEEDKVNEILSYSNDDKINATLFRKLVNGKFDSLTTDNHYNDEIKKKLPEREKKVYRIIERNRIKNKTSWSDDWINYLFTNYIDKIPGKNKKIDAFKSYFPELYDIIKHIEIKSVKE